jgi:hypothetical protein
VVTIEMPAKQGARPLRVVVGTQPIRTTRHLRPGVPPPEVAAVLLDCLRAGKTMTRVWLVVRGRRVRLRRRSCPRLKRSQQSSFLWVKVGPMSWMVPRLGRSCLCSD